MIEGGRREDSGDGKDSERVIGWGGSGIGLGSLLGVLKRRGKGETRIQEFG